MLLLGRVPRQVDVPSRVVVGVEVPVERRWLVDLAEVGVLGEEPAKLGIEVAGYDRLRRIPVAPDQTKPDAFRGLAVLQD